ncbi:DUF4372 domain-containing protein [Nitrosomonas sp. Is37]|uniref:DUF4372 domain-containing protein n=1 Tax=Nitrosomonas sp. Is37 TaxID=3080535 RepID=UPI003982CEC7
MVDEFETIASAHHLGQKLRKRSRWAQLVAMVFVQLSGRASANVRAILYPESVQFCTPTRMLLQNPAPLAVE